jgi:hypothetical protein
VATYYDIFGQKVQYLASDPSPVQIGQVWYNSTSNTAKFQGFSTATWSSGGSTNRTFGSGGGFGGNTGAVIFCGSDGSPPTNPVSNLTETYDGTTWSPATNYPTELRDLSGTGTSASGLGICGQGPTTPVTTCVEWTGASWTGIPNNPTPLRGNTAFGIETAAVNCGGGEGVPEATVAKTQEYDGSGWTNSNNMNTGRKVAGGCGTQTLGLIAGGTGYPGVPEPTQGDLVEEYDGTSWSNSNTLNNLRNSDIGMTGTQTNSIIYGGNHPTGAPNATEEYDGTCWTTLSGVTLPITGGTEINGNGSTSQPTAFFVKPGTGTLEFNAAAAVTRTITTS